MKYINAVYNDETIRVYQAFNEKIATEAVELGTFGKSFKLKHEGFEEIINMLSYHLIMRIWEFHVKNGKNK